MRQVNLLFATAALLALASSTQAAELIANGGFENGAYTVALNDRVPVDWTPNTAFANDTHYAAVYTDVPHSGTNYLVIGNNDDQPVDSLSQSFSDVAGATYTASYWAFVGRAGDPNAFLSVSIDGAPLSTLDDTVNSYQLNTFTFIGTGHDTLAISARTNPNVWHVDDVSVLGAAPGGVPEPTSWALMLVGFGGLGAALRGSRRKPALAAA